MTIITAVMLLSIGFQMTSSIIALKLIRITQRKFVWSFISLSTFLMVLRRCISLYNYYFEPGSNIHITSEAIALITSILLTLGIFGIRQLFLDLKKNEELISVKNQELESLSYRITHDLRTPLTHIKGFVDLLADNISDKENKHFINKINSNIAKMDYLISDLLKFLRHGQTTTEKTKVLILDMCNDLISNHSKQIKKEHVEVITDIDNSLFIYCSYNSFYEALENIFANALKYVAHSDVKKIWISGYPAKNNVIISIKDTGPGIPETERKNIFEPFYRINNGKNIQGTGLGLAITKKIVDEHNGKIDIEANTPHGSIFTITLPH